MKESSRDGADALMPSTPVDEPAARQAPQPAEAAASRERRVRLARYAESSTEARLLASARSATAAMPALAQSVPRGPCTEVPVGFCADGEQLAVKQPQCADYLHLPLPISEPVLVEGAVLYTHEGKWHEHICRDGEWQLRVSDEFPVEPKPARDG